MSLYSNLCVRLREKNPAKILSAPKPFKNERAAREIIRKKDTVAANASERDTKISKDKSPCQREVLGLKKAAPHPPAWRSIGLLALLVS